MVVFIQWRNILLMVVSMLVIYMVNIMIGVPIKEIAITQSINYKKTHYNANEIIMEYLEPCFAILELVMIGCIITFAIITRND